MNQLTGLVLASRTVHVVVDQSSWAQWLPVGASIAVALLTAVYVVITLRLIKAASAANEIAKNAVDAEREARTATQAQSTAMIRETERTRLAGSTPQVTIMFVRSDVSKYSPVPPKPDDVEGRINRAYSRSESMASVEALDLGIDTMTYDLRLTLSLRNHGPGAASLHVEEMPAGGSLTRAMSGPLPEWSIISEGESWEVHWTLGAVSAAQFVTRFEHDPLREQPKELIFRFTSSSSVTNVSDEHVLVGCFTGLEYVVEPGGAGQKYTLDTQALVTFDNPIAMTTRTWPPMTTT
jgi:hypothetical protein